MKKIVLCILFVMHAVIVFGQGGTGFTGKVVDLKSQKPLQNVVVAITNSSFTETTNTEGVFVFSNVSL